ncbi:MerR family mercuric resistance operon transcriptional regulator [Sphingopyxis italica]|uniref:Transcriptional regulator n=2 Tax=Sphingopyxis TaxID=165697 RepID=A0AAC9AXK3_SPHMC|nr:MULTISPECIES: helix-turn-helix domain-containing protein [Sphingopyxis]ALJ15565.1 transcriptional regulator [Sphingopyxis macrogoltabida]AMU91806.1 transcriptional regulator [Sphingopyxis macrogoltabida]NJB90756.1 MerR family mercuric resistance operon transcriptional regulator [Sphingopyxis italica]
MPPSSTIPIGEVSRRTGCNIETIRYYERIGILPAPVRRGRFRRYDSADVRRLAFVRRARELGFPLHTIRTLLALAEGGGHSCDQARQMAETQLSDVRAKQADLERMAVVLDELVRACGAGDASGCPLLEALSD